MTTFARLLLYGGALLVIGDVFAARSAGSTWRSRVSAAGPRPMLIAWLAVLAALLVLFVAQFVALDLAPTTADVALLVRETTWGHGWALLVATGLAGAATSAVGAPLILRLVIVLALAVAMGGLGHAAADEAVALARALDAAHVLSMGAWIGTLAVVVMFAGGLEAQDHSALWTRFSRLATIAAPLTVLSGVGSAFRRVGVATLPQIVASDYGRLLGAKTALVVGILVLGALHRRAVSRGRVPATTSLRVELLCAAAVLVVTAVLTATAPPGE